MPAGSLYRMTQLHEIERRPHCSDRCLCCPNRGSSLVSTSMSLTVELAIINTLIVVALILVQGIGV